jgi:hypothetical protein
MPSESTFSIVANWSSAQVTFDEVLQDAKMQGAGSNQSLVGLLHVSLIRGLVLRFAMFLRDPILIR